jgi:hypothetical protein
MAPPAASQAIHEHSVNEVTEYNIAFCARYRRRALADHLIGGSLDYVNELFEPNLEANISFTNS